MSATGDPAVLPAAVGGFTLIEVLVALAIMAMIAGIGFPMLDRALDRMTMERSVILVESALGAARAAALRGEQPVRVALTDAGHALEVGTATPVAMPARILLKSAASAIIFYPDGSATGGRIDVTGPRGGNAVLVAADTGLLGRAQ